MDLNKFIEERINLIDEDLWGFFVNEVYNELNEQQAQDLIVVFNDANIDTEDIREGALHFIITMTLENWDPQEMKDLYLMNFITEQLHNTLGFGQSWVMQYMKDNAKEWIDYVTFKKVNGIWDIMEPKEK